MELAGNTRLRLARSLRLRPIGQMARGFGRFLGIFGAVVMAVLDGIESVRQFAKRNYVRGFGYLVVSGMGVAVVYLLWVGSTGVGLFLVVAVIGASLLLDYFKPDKMELWLERCYEWGRLTDQRYRDERAEKRELDLALGRAG